MNVFTVTVHCIQCTVTVCRTFKHPLKTGQTKYCVKPCFYQTSTSPMRDIFLRLWITFIFYRQVYQNQFSKYCVSYNHNVGSGSGRILMILYKTLDPYKSYIELDPDPGSSFRKYNILQYNQDKSIKKRSLGSGCGIWILKKWKVGSGST